MMMSSKKSLNSSTLSMLGTLLAIASCASRNESKDIASFESLRAHMLEWPTVLMARMFLLPSSVIAAWIFGYGLFKVREISLIVFERKMSFLNSSITSSRFFGSFMLYLFWYNIIPYLNVVVGMVFLRPCPWYPQTPRGRQG